jgi:ATP-binding protein involved in chromosome partitioning
MSFFVAPELPDRKYYIFGKEGGRKLAEESGTDLLGQIPMVESICNGGDAGTPAALGDSATGLAFMALADAVVDRVNKRNAEMAPTKKVEIK